jgi:hypothetical protein
MQQWTSQTGILLRFRQRPVAVVEDISGMYLEVVKSRSKSHQSVLRILYRKPDSDKPIETLQMSRHGLGARPQFVNSRGLRPTNDTREWRRWFRDTLTLVAFWTRWARKVKWSRTPESSGLVRWMSSFCGVSNDSTEWQIKTIFRLTERSPSRWEGDRIYLDWDKGEFLFKFDIQQAQTMRRVLQPFTTPWYYFVY